MPEFGYLLNFLYLKEIIFERIIFRISALQCLHLTLTFRTAENLRPNFQKPPLPSKIPGYAPDLETIQLARINNFQQCIFNTDKHWSHFNDFL